MKIIKQGKTDEELKAILNKTKRFECRTCDCVFEADESEYETEEVQIFTPYHYCKCPNCGKKANEVKMRKTDKEAEEDISNIQEETKNNNEYKYLESFSVVRRNGKQYNALVELFKKTDQKKVDAAYREAYGDIVIWRTSQPFTRDHLDSLIEGSRAFTRKFDNEWYYGPPTKREEMWAEIFAIHKRDDVVIKVKKEDISTFLHEMEKRIPEITWASGVKIFEAKYTIKDIYDGLKTRDTAYFRLSKETKLSYSSDPHIYPYRDLKHINYLPPMRWDLFKKGRIVVGVRKEQYKEFKEAIMQQFGAVNIHNPYDGFDYSFFIYDKHAKFVESVGRSQFRQPKIINNHKVVYWEDVR